MQRTDVVDPTSTSLIAVGGHGAVSERHGAAVVDSASWSVVRLVVRDTGVGDVHRSLAVVDAAATPLVRVEVFRDLGASHGDRSPAVVDSNADIVGQHAAGDVQRSGVGDTGV